MTTTILPSARKAMLTIKMDCHNDVKISFYPDSQHTTPESLRELIRDACDLKYTSRFVLRLEEDDSMVPCDTTLEFVQCVKLIEIKNERADTYADAVSFSAGSPSKNKGGEGHVTDRALLDISSFVLNVATRITAESEPEQVFLSIADKIKNGLDVDCVRLYLRGNQMGNPSKQLVLVGSTNANDRAVADSPDLPSVMAKRAVKTSQVNWTSSQICVPILLNDGTQVSAVLEVERFLREDLDADSKDAVEFVASHVGSVIHSMLLVSHSNRRAQTLLNVTKVLASVKKPDEIISLIVKETYELLRAERVAVFLVHAQDQELEICLSKDAAGMRIPMTKGVAAYVARTGETVNVPDAQNDPRFDPATDLATGFKTKAMLCCPITDATNRVIGVIQACNKICLEESDNAVDPNTGKNPRFSLRRTSSIMSVLSLRKFDDDSLFEHEVFDDDDRELLESLTQSAGVMLQNAQLLAAAEHARTTARTLLRFVHRIVGEADFLRLDEMIRAGCRQLLDCDRCIVAWINRVDNELCIFLEANESVRVSFGTSAFNAEAYAFLNSTSLSCCNIPDLAAKQLKSQYDVKSKYETKTMLACPIAGGAQGFIAVVFALNKLEQELSLAQASPVSAKSAMKRPVRPIKPFAKEDETDMIMFCNEVEGSLRVKRNLQSDFTHLLFSEMSNDEFSTVEAAAPGSSTDATSNARRAGSPSDRRTDDFDSQRRLMALYTASRNLPSGQNLTAAQRASSTLSQKTFAPLTISTSMSTSVDDPKTPLTAGTEPDVSSMPFVTKSKHEVAFATKAKHETVLVAVKSKLEKDFVTQSKADAGGEFSNAVVKSSCQDDGTDEEEDLYLDDDKISALETESLMIVQDYLLDVRSTNALGQPLEIIKKWTLALFFDMLPTMYDVGLDVAKFPKFVASVHDHYNANPFHNFYHAFAVLHTANSIVRNTVEGRKMDDTTTIGILLAALCHDLGHKGMTNSFEVATMSDLAIRYSDEAVLERYHCYMSFFIMFQDPSSNILACLPNGSMTVLRRTIIEGILATDMQRHAEHVSELESKIVEGRQKLFMRNGSFQYDEPIVANSNGGDKRSPAVRARRISSSESNSMSPMPSSSPLSSLHDTPQGLKRRSSIIASSIATSGSGSEKFRFDRVTSSPFESSEGTSLFVRSVVHTSDLSSQTLKFEYAEDWGRRITAEFAAQADVERLRFLPVSVPLCSNELDFYKSQIFFIRQIVMPLWRSFAELVPELAVHVDSLEKNVEVYEGKAAKCLEITNGVEVASAVVAALPNAATGHSPEKPPKVPSSPVDGVSSGNRSKRRFSPPPPQSDAPSAMTSFSLEQAKE